MFVYILDSDNYPSALSTPIHLFLAKFAAAAVAADAPPHLFLSKFAAAAVAAAAVAAAAFAAAAAVTAAAAAVTAAAAAVAAATADAATADAAVAAAAGQTSPIRCCCRCAADITYPGVEESSWNYLYFMVCSVVGTFILFSALTAIFEET